MTGWYSDIFQDFWLAKSMNFETLVGFTSKSNGPTFYWPPALPKVIGVPGGPIEGTGGGSLTVMYNISSSFSRRFFTGEVRPARLMRACARPGCGMRRWRWSKQSLFSLQLWRGIAASSLSGDASTVSVIEANTWSKQHDSNPGFLLRWIPVIIISRPRELLIFSSCWWRWRRTRWPTF